MNKAIQLIYLLTALTTSTITQAEQTRFYIGGSLGYVEDKFLQTEIDRQYDGLSEWSDSVTATGKEEMGFKIFAGHNLTDNLSVEIAYMKLRNMNINTEASVQWSDIDPTEIHSASIDIDVNGFVFAGIASVPIHKKSFIFAKAGFFVWESETIRKEIADYGNNAVHESIRISDKDNGTSGMFGIGATYKIKSNTSLRAEWERFDFGNEDIDLYSLGLHFNF